jgi:cytochrome c peroxidase
MSRIAAGSLLGAGLLLGLALLRWLAPAAPATALSWSESERAVLETLVLPGTLPPSSSAWADSPAAAHLGRRLFFDAGLGIDGEKSCSSCHDPDRFFTDGRPTAEGMSRLARNAPTVIGAAAFPFLMWDGRKDSLWSQALGPLETPEEMGSHRLLVALEIRERHAAEYTAAFGPLPALPEDLPRSATREEAVARYAALDPARREEVDEVFVRAGKALEAYERRLLPRPSPFDEFVAALEAGDPAGGDHLSEAAQRGLKAFLGEAGCIHCHNGPWFSDLAFHNVALPAGEGEPADPGRQRGIERLLADPFRSDGRHADHLGNAELRHLDIDLERSAGAFKTPSLRNVAETGPWGHAGQFATLEEVLHHYESRPRRTTAGNPDPLLDHVPDRLPVADLVAFLRALTGPLPPRPWGCAPDRSAEESKEKLAGGAGPRE